ncbi:MAG: N-6 DNA methylase [Rhodocyclaceae bacterium]|nr:N-6 DNA methylase [Rhodocyclaceae bacterium]
MKQVSVDNAAQIIGVSSATIRNWAKAGYINPTSTRPLSFLEESVLNLKEQIGSEAFLRLTTRANKAAASNNFFPEEYAINAALLSHITKISEYLKEEGLDIELVMFLAALHLLADKGEVVLPRGTDELFDLNNCTSWRRQSVKEVMFGWMASLDVGKSTKSYCRLPELFFPHEEEDYLGLLYQSVSSEGCKSELGSYFTPTKLVMDSLAHIKAPVKTFLDPCCGTGKFLIHAAQTFSLEPENVLGFDIDRIAIHVAKVNLLLAYSDQEFLPRIYRMDSLSELATGEMFCETNNLMGSIDAIATNPPWGAYKNSAAKGHLSGAIRSGETFSLFLEKSIRLLRDGGQLSFILPESILKIRAHSDIRALLLNETTITTIALLGRQFTGVYTPVIRLDVFKERPSDQWMVRVEHDGTSHNVLQSRFDRNENVTFDIQIKSHEEDLLERIYSVEHLTLAGNAEWALGIVTGDNKKHVLDMPGPGTEPVFRGSDIYPFFLGEPNSHICFAPEQYQQVASEKYYRASEKLLYKFISKKLVFAYDDKQCLSLNSANILIPAIADMDMKVVLAFLNSNVFQYIFTKKFSTHKVLRGDLEKLPFPRLSRSTHDAIEHLVDVAIASRRAPEELQEIIFGAFNLDAEDSALITDVIQG